MQGKNSINGKRLFFKNFKITSYISTSICLVALMAIIIQILIEGVPYLSLDLIFGVYDETPSIFPALIGTLELVFLSILIAGPIGIFTAIFLVEYLDNDSLLVCIIRISIETLAGIPSIVYGLFGYLIFVVSMNLGYSLLGGGLTLAIMILPIIVRSTEESLISVPNELREGSFALGAGKTRTIFKVVLPTASNGIIAAIILAMGRVLSESAVLILTIGMVVNKVPTSIMSSGTSLALDIYYFASYGYPNEAAATSLVLLVLIIVLNLLATLVGKLSRKGKTNGK